MSKRKLRIYALVGIEWVGEGADDQECISSFLRTTDLGRLFASTKDGCRTFYADEIEEIVVEDHDNPEYYASYTIADDGMIRRSE